MQDKDRDLSGYRLSLAQETLANAKLCMDNQFYRDCINRSYYAAFYAIKAVLATESVDFKRHKDAVGYFNKKYVATGISHTNANSCAERPVRFLKHFNLPAFSFINILLSIFLYYSIHLFRC